MVTKFYDIVNLNQSAPHTAIGIWYRMRSYAYGEMVKNQLFKLFIVQVFIDPECAPFVKKWILIELKIPFHNFQCLSTAGSSAAKGVLESLQVVLIAPESFQKEINNNCPTDHNCQHPLSNVKVNVSCI